MAIVYTFLLLQLRPPLLMLMDLPAGSCPAGTQSACCCLSLVVGSCLTSPPRLPASTTCHLSPSSVLASILAFGKYTYAHILCPQGIHQHMYIIGQGQIKTQNHMKSCVNTQKQRPRNPHMCISERTRRICVVWGADKALSLSLSFGIHYGPGLLSESLSCLREVPICGSMWQGGSKSPLMNQYVGGLSLWRGRPRIAIPHPGKNVCICSHQTLVMSADI